MPSPSPARRYADHVPVRRAVRVAAAGVAAYALVQVLGRIFFHYLPINPNSPDAWIFGAVSVGILAVAVVFVLGIAPGLSRRRDAQRPRAAMAAADPPDARTRH